MLEKPNHRRKILQPFLYSALIITIFLGLDYIIFGTVKAAGLESEKPFWLPYTIDVGEDFFKVNVFILGVQEDTGLLKVCVVSEHKKSQLCHYMDAKEEGQIIRPFVSVHGGIFVFPSNQIPESTTANVCVTLLLNGTKECKSVLNSLANTEEVIDIDVR